MFPGPPAVPDQPATSPEAAPDRRFVAAAAGIFVLALLLRLHRLGAESFWLDEVLQVTCTRLSLGGLWECFPADKPPLDYLVQWLFLRAGESEFLARLHAAIFGAATVAALAYWGRLLGGTRLGLIAAAIAFANPLLMRFSQEGRPYALMLFVETLALVTLWSILRARDPMHPRRWLWLAGALMLCLWTHYQALFAALTAGLLAGIIVLVRWLRTRTPSSPQSPVPLLQPLLIIGALLTGIPLLLRAMGAPPSEFDAPYHPDTWRSVAVYLDVYTLGYEWWHRVAGAWILFAAFAAIGAITWLARRRFAEVSFCLLFFVICFGGPFLFYWSINHWMEMRYTLAAYPAAVMLVAMGVEGVGMLGGRLMPANRTRAESIMISVYVATILAFTLFHTLTNPFHRQDWRGLVQEIRKEQRDNTVVLMGAAFNRFPVQYYLNRFQMNVPVIVANNDPEMLRSLQAEGKDVWVVVEGYAVPKPFRVEVDKLQQFPIYGIELRHAAPATSEE
jgi:4-amino-4-deoxy-L-arabinose transferase-like glycosyltransferase